ncbi:midasin isoform X2 [Teleopsis dalmanni]|uniref:midasin isoform X2 n=1 Tax=Teleopsis dalmanni TaxID=139649 RepID=UPI0018CD3DF1|nr:midasin isoform X2 [Teleopsis dalmanni]
MSGDVQPRKRKDKKRKHALDRKPEGDISRQSSFQDEDESSHGVHITKMGTDDVHLHVHHDHGTGGHWCAKVLFFSLLAILLGIISLIILENRGLSDLDTPLSESRFSNYFDGWVEEHREEHGHDAVEASIQEHDEHDEPFEEEEDDEEADEEEDEEEEDEHEHDIEGDDDENEKDTKEDSEENITEEPSTETDKDDEDEDKGEENVTEEVSKEQTVEDEDDDNDINEDTAENDEEPETKETREDNDNNVSNADEEDEEDEQDENTAEAEDAEESNEPITVSQENSQQTNEDDDDNENDEGESKDKDNEDEDEDEDSKNNEEPFDEEDDDGTFESLENVVDNDAEEMALLKEKARLQAEEAEKNAPPSAEDNEEGGAASSWASSLAVKIGVGVALALVARLVLIRKNPNSIVEMFKILYAFYIVRNSDEPLPEVVMKRRLTIATAEDNFPDDEEVPLLPEDEQYSEEEIEIEEEIEYVDDDDDQDPVYIKDRINADKSTYVPETFEDLNAQYRPKDYKPIIITESTTTNKQTDNVYDKNDNKNFNKATVTTTSSLSTSTQASHQFSMPSTASPSVQTNLQNTTPKTTLSAQTEMIDIPFTAASSSVSAQKPPKTVVQSTPSPKPIKRVVTHDVETLDSDEDLDYDPDDIYDGEELSEEEEEDEVEIDEDILDEASDEISDVDDTELMNRLEAKYGRLPTKEYESDEDPDDPTWTQIKAKQPSDNTGGAQAYNIDDNDENEYYDDLFEKELRRANEEMMRENYNAALKLYDELSQAHPDKPKIFLVKAKALDQLSEKQRSNYLLKEALNAYKRYLAFDKILKNHTEYREAGNRCIERLRFLGLHMQTIAIHQYMIDRFPDEPEHKNQLVVSWLMMNRYTEAKIILKEILKRWPDDGFAQVHYGFILKQYYMDNENAALYLKKGIDSKAPGTQDGRFFYNLGDALQRLHRQPEALEIYKRGAELKLYPSTYQRSLYNYPSLLAQPFWTKEETTYASFFDILENNWQAIRDEGLNLLSADNLFLNEAENLREIGDWKQFEIYARGQRHDENCNKAPMTCEMIESFHAASKCKRGQVKFSVMLPNTHVWPHCGPTNCRLRAHLGLVIPDGTAIRVAEETRNWQEGKFIIFDDSFEHEVWHNGSSMRLVLIVDVWHPQLTELQRTYLSPI